MIVDCVSASELDVIMQSRDHAAPFSKFGNCIPISIVISASVSNLEIAQFFGCSIIFGLFSVPSLVLLSCWFGSHGLRVAPSGVTTTEAEEAVASYRYATIFACKKPL